MALSSIANGTFFFVNLSAPPPVLVGQQINARARAGLKNWQGQRIGRIPQGAFVSRSLADTLTPAGAFTLADAYVDFQAVANEPVQVTWGIHDYSTSNHLYVIENVRIIFAGAVVLGVGGINGTSLGRVVADWTFRPVWVEPPPEP